MMQSSSKEKKREAGIPATSGRKRKRQSSSFFVKDISHTTLYASGILVLAIIFGAAWNQVTEDRATDPFIRSYLTSFCSRSSRLDGDSFSFSHYCDPALAPSRRTQKATRPIPRGRTLLEIPRDLQLWTLDALRDPFVQQELFSAKQSRRAATTSQHSSRGASISLSQDAFLAAYLALQIVAPKHSTDTRPGLYYQYLDLLPNRTHFEEYHPVLWPDSQLQQLLGDFTYASEKLQYLKKGIRDEYDAFAKASPDKFAKLVSFQDYQTAKLNVMTRSFGTGPLPPSEALASISLTQELREYEEQLGIDLSRGVNAMVPVLDFFDSHPNPHVEYHYDGDSRSFVVRTIRSVNVGDEVYDSYGRHSDGHLFANYGFLNGDGSSYTQASLALQHQVLGTDTMDEKLFAQLALYLLDDGYGRCVSANDPNEGDGPNLSWELKKYKLLHLKTIAYDLSRWTITVKPRDPNALPGPTSDVAPALKVPKLDPAVSRVNPNRLYSTCRLMVLKEEDYGGKALDILKENLNNPSNFDLPRTEDALEYRTMWCTIRLAQSALSRFPRSLEEQESLVAQLNSKGFQTPEWLAAHVILGEQQTLDTVKKLAIMGAQRFRDKDHSTESYSMRNKPCSTSIVNETIELGRTLGMV